MKISGQRVGQTQTITAPGMLVATISPILLYIGMLIDAQAFQESPKAHAPAIILALTPRPASLDPGWRP